jgi:uncharacterized protein (TIGR02246 family)
VTPPIPSTSSTARAAVPQGPLTVLLAALLLGLQILLGPVQPAHADTPACAPISERQVAGLFERWNDALASGDPAQVAGLYSDDALLLPTLSAEPRHGPAAIRDYFTDFLARAPRGRIDSRTIQLGCNSAVDAGTYSFEVSDGGSPDQPGQRHWVNARYTFFYSYGDGGWRIQHHHSSLQPPA